MMVSLYDLWEVDWYYEKELKNYAEVFAEELICFALLLF